MVVWVAHHEIDTETVALCVFDSEEKAKAWVAEYPASPGDFRDYDKFEVQ